MNSKQNKIIMIGISILIVISLVYLAHTMIQKNTIAKRRHARKQAKKYAIKRRGRMNRMRAAKRVKSGMGCNKDVSRAYVVSPIPGL